MKYSKENLKILTIDEYILEKIEQYHKIENMNCLTIAKYQLAAKRKIAEMKANDCYYGYVNIELEDINKISNKEIIEYVKLLKEQIN